MCRFTEHTFVKIAIAIVCNLNKHTKLHKGSELTSIEDMNMSFDPSWGIKDAWIPSSLNEYPRNNFQDNTHMPVRWASFAVNDLD